MRSTYTKLPPPLVPENIDMPLSWGIQYKEERRRPHQEQAVNPLWGFFVQLLSLEPSGGWSSNETIKPSLGRRPNRRKVFQLR
jgi:hypothetical protein